MNTVTKFAFSLVLLANSLCFARPPECDPGPKGCDNKSLGSKTFAKELANFSKQFLRDSSAVYQKQVLELHVFEKLHGAADCFSKSSESLTVIVEIDRKGRVKKTLTSVESPKASCFRKSYSNARLPSPPNGRFLYAMEMVGDDGASEYHSDPSDGGGGGPRLPTLPKCDSRSSCGL